MHYIDLIQFVIHTAEYVLPREEVVRWLRNHAPDYQFTDHTTKSKIARMFAIRFYKEYKHELKATIEQTVARERARSTYEAWLTGVEAAIRTGELRSVRDYFSSNEGDYYTLHTRVRLNDPDTANGYYI